MSARKLITAIFFLLLISYANGQGKIKNKIGVGFSYDNISGYGNLLLRYITLKGHLTADAEFSNVRYGNFAVGINSNYYPFLKSKISPFVGITCTRSFGGEVGFDKDLQLRVSPATYLSPFVGIKYDIDGIYSPKGKLTDNIISLFIKFGYKISIAANPTVSIISGTDTNNRLAKSIRYLDDKFVFGFGFLYCW